MAWDVFAPFVGIVFAVLVGLVIFFVARFAYKANKALDKYLQNQKKQDMSEQQQPK